MTAFDADLALVEAPPKDASLVDLLGELQTALNKAVDHSKKGGATGLQEGIRDTVLACLRILKALGESPDKGMEGMFETKKSSAKEWAAQLQPPLEDKSTASYLMWWQETETRLANELVAPISAAKQGRKDRELVEGIRALIMEAFAASVMAHPGAKVEWRKILTT